MTLIMVRGKARESLDGVVKEEKRRNMHANYSFISLLLKTTLVWLCPTSLITPSTFPIRSLYYSEPLFVGHFRHVLVMLCWSWWQMITDLQIQHGPTSKAQSQRLRLSITEDTWNTTTFISWSSSRSNGHNRPVLPQSFHIVASAN